MLYFLNKYILLFLIKFFILNNIIIKSSLKIVIFNNKYI